MSLPANLPFTSSQGPQTFPGLWNPGKDRPLLSHQHSVALNQTLAPPGVSWVSTLESPRLKHWEAGPLTGAAGGGWVGLTEGSLTLVGAMSSWADPPGRSVGPGGLIQHWRPTRAGQRVQEKGAPVGQDKADASLLLGQDKCQSDGNRDHFILGCPMA